MAFLCSHLLFLPYSDGPSLRPHYSLVVTHCTSIVIHYALPAFLQVITFSQVNLFVISLLFMPLIHLLILILLSDNVSFPIWKSCPYCNTGQPCHGASVPAPMYRLPHHHYVLVLRIS